VLQDTAARTSTAADLTLVELGSVDHDPADFDDFYNGEEDRWAHRLNGRLRGHAVNGVISSARMNRQKTEVI
jgi:hypothetical protein